MSGQHGRQFTGRLGLQQRVLPHYRVPFFDRLAAACSGGLSVYAGEPRAEEAIRSATSLKTARLERAQNWHLLGGPLYLCLQPGVTRWLAAWDPDALILEANPRYPSNLSAIRWMKSRGRPVLGWGLGVAPGHSLLGAIRAGLRKRYLRQFDGLLAYSSRGADAYRAAGVPADRIFVAHNAVAPAPPSPPDRAPLTGRAARLLFVGRLQSRKRVDALLQAAAELAPRQPLEVWIVGDGPARAGLEKLANRLGLNARFFGALDGGPLQERYQKADVFVLPGTGGLAVQEAMGYALPVVVAAGDGTQDDLVRPENGWLLPGGEAEALAAVLRRALEDPVRLRQMGMASHRIVAEEINLESMVESFVDALESVCGG